MRVLVLAFRVEVTRARPASPGAGRKHKAFTWSPTRTVSKIEGRVALPGATDEQLVRVGQGVPVLPNRREGNEAGRAAGRATGGCGATALQAACTGAGPTRGGGQGTSRERTSNMFVKSVTLDVSKLSGWLNAGVYCQESKGGHAVCGARFWSVGGRRRATAGQAACRGGLDCRLGAEYGEERTHAEHVLHGRDAGGVEAQRLVERRRGLLRVERRAYGEARCWSVGGRRRGRPRGKQRAGAGEDSTADWEQSMGRSAR